MQAEEARTQLEADLGAYLASLAHEKRYSRNTIAAYRNDLGQFVDHVDVRHAAPDGRWASMPPDIVTDYIVRLKDMTWRDPSGREKHMATSTVARKIAALKSFFRHLLKTGTIESDPSTGLDTPKVKKRLPRTLSSAHVELLLAAPGRSTQPKSLRDRALLELLYATGMRVSELVALNLSDIDPENKLVTVRSDRGNKERRIPVSDRALQALRDYQERGRPH